MLHVLLCCHSQDRSSKWSTPRISTMTCLTAPCESFFFLVSYSSSLVLQKKCLQLHFKLLHPVSISVELMALISKNLQDMQNLLETMMQQLLSKEVLYEPMKEIVEHYPIWLESFKSEHITEDLARYTRLHDLITQLCLFFFYSKVVELLQDM
ncbi:peroxisome biogenesis protein 19-1-like [Physcomitrium patens]|uniref:Uncharacterized protein n=1 Tax=Physcomitrium patens TaxID=3218 RepID=A0A2K1L989_PHYPA|nr:hypothetical protein PHYPA_001019 [Physcomitrium patens]